MSENPTDFDQSVPSPRYPVGVVVAEKVAAAAGVPVERAAWLLAGCPPVLAGRVADLVDTARHAGESTDRAGLDTAPAEVKTPDCAVWCAEHSTGPFPYWQTCHSAPRDTGEGREVQAVKVVDTSLGGPPEITRSVYVNGEDMSPGEARQLIEGIRGALADLDADAGTTSTEVHAATGDTRPGAAAQQCAMWCAEHQADGPWEGWQVCNSTRTAIGDGITVSHVRLVDENRVTHRTVHVTGVDNDTPLTAGPARRLADAIRRAADQLAADERACDPERAAFDAIDDWCESNRINLSGADIAALTSTGAPIGTLARILDATFAAGRRVGRKSSTR